jgi:hypothetical protein
MGAGFGTIRISAGGAVLAAAGGKMEISRDFAAAYGPSSRWISPRAPRSKRNICKPHLDLRLRLSYFDIALQYVTMLTL